MPIQSHILDSYPKGWANPSVARISAVLPAAGAWDTTPLELVTAYASFAQIGLTYTRGAVNGAVDYQIEVSLYSGAAIVPAGAAEWLEQTVIAIGALVPGADTQSATQAEYQTFQAASAAAETVTLAPIELGGVVERMRIRARESGVVGTPGTCQISMNLI